MTEVDLTGFAHRLRLTTEILAADARQQLAYLHGLGLVELVDELVLQFDDAVVLLPRLSGEHLVSEQAAVAVRKVDAHLAQMSSGSADVWSEEAVRTSPEWGRVRELAAAALALLPVISPPAGAQS